MGQEKLLILNLHEVVGKWKNMKKDAVFKLI